MPCTATPDLYWGSECAVATSFDALVPGSVSEGNRSIWQLDQGEVYDGGDDGVVATARAAALWGR